MNVGEKMIVGIGVDLVELYRMEKIIKESPRFVKKVLTPDEYRCFEQKKGRHQVEYLAGRFAAKEAFSKAWGTGIGKLTFQDIEVLNEANGRPYVAASPHVGRVHISLSHSETQAIAYVILEK